MRTLLALNLLALTLACGGDKEPEASNALSDRAAGTYAGTLTVGLDESPDYQVVVTRVSDNVVSIAAADAAGGGTFDGQLVGSEDVHSTTEDAELDSEDVDLQTGLFNFTDGALNYTVNIPGQSLAVFAGTKQ